MTTQNNLATTQPAPIQRAPKVEAEGPEPLDAKKQATARNDAVADLVKISMSKAGELKLTAEETKELTSEFEDSDFQKGAAGKEDLIYIEHAALRDRLNNVLGMGQWALIIRETWNENFVTAKGTRGVRVYSRGMLIIRGSYVAEAIGDMEYYPSNNAQNYGDAYEGSKTAAFRRCAKEFGIGLQQWRKDYCKGWFERNGKNRMPPMQRGPDIRPPTQQRQQQPVQDAQVVQHPEDLDIPEGNIPDEPGAVEQPETAQVFVKSIGQQKCKNGSIRYLLKGDDGKMYVTFDEKVMLKAKEKAAAGAACEISFEMGKYGLDITLIK